MVLKQCLSWRQARQSCCLSSRYLSKKAKSARTIKPRCPQSTLTHRLSAVSPATPTTARNKTKLRPVTPKWLDWLLGRGWRSGTPKWRGSDMRNLWLQFRAEASAIRWCFEGDRAARPCHLPAAHSRVLDLHPRPASAAAIARRFFLRDGRPVCVPGSRQEPRLPGSS